LDINKEFKTTISEEHETIILQSPKESLGIEIYVRSKGCIVLIRHKETNEALCATNTMPCSKAMAEKVALLIIKEIKRGATPYCIRTFFFPFPK
jgi:hypothetical protein